MNLKDFFDGRVVEGIARDIERVHPEFDAAAFTASCLKRLEELELLARGWHIADALKQHLPAEFDNAVEVLVRSLDAELEATKLNGMAPFRYLPHVFFVSKYGLEHFEPAMRAQYELTKRFSAEYSIRA